MKFKYITIEREYGSGGTLIAHQLSEETGIPCYGREILEAVSVSRNIPVRDIEKYEESVTNSFLYTLYAIGQAQSGNTDMLSQEGHIFVDEQEEIRKMAQNGKSIFLGHCASEALKKEKGVLKVYIRCSDDAEKRNRIIRDYAIPEHDVDKTKNTLIKSGRTTFLPTQPKNGTTTGIMTLYWTALFLVPMAVSPS